MNILEEKIKLAQLILSSNNPESIRSIKEIFEKEKQTIDFWDELTPEQQQEIKEGTKEIAGGKTTDYEEFIAKHRE